MKRKIGFYFYNNFKIYIALLLGHLQQIQNFNCFVFQFSNYQKHYLGDEDLDGVVF